MPNNKNYREKLVRQIKDAGQELINRAETYGSSRSRYDYGFPYYPQFLSGEFSGS